MKQFIKSLAIAILASIGLVGILVSQPRSDSPRYSLTIKPSKPDFIVGSRIEIAITIANISEESIVFRFDDYGGRALGFEYDVRDGEGKRVSKVIHKDPLQPSRPPGTSMKGIIPPGKSVDEGSIISEIYEFDHPGSYTIQVSRKEPGKPTVDSNKITIAVIAKPDSSMAKPEEDAPGDRIESICDLALRMRIS